MTDKQKAILEMIVKLEWAINGVLLEADQEGLDVMILQPVPFHPSFRLRFVVGTKLPAVKAVPNDD